MWKFDENLEPKEVELTYKQLGLRVEGFKTPSSNSSSQLDSMASEAKFQSMEESKQSRGKIKGFFKSIKSLFASTKQV